MNENDLKILEIKLNEIITTCLHGPSSDPEAENLRASAGAYKLLRHFNLSVKDEDLIKPILSGENLYLYDYLEDKDNV